MEIALFDTSVWINYSNGNVNNATNLVDGYLRDHFDEIMGNSNCHSGVF
jgi:hypothetical protein